MLLTRCKADRRLFLAAPTGRLDSWMKVSGDHSHKQLNIQLFWKVHTSHTAAWHLPQTRLSLIALAEGVRPAFRIYEFVFFYLQPSKQFCANGQNVSYVVSVQKSAGEKGKLCSTTRNYCTFLLPRKVKRVYLSAVNAAGKSSPTEVHIHHPKGKPDLFKYCML